MAVSAEGRPRTRHAFFVTTPYRVRGETLAAAKPDRGPCWDGAAECQVSLDHHRRRKTGPPWGWVAVMRCAPHRSAFTAYPPGHVPYGRVPLVALAPDGGTPESDGDPPGKTLFTAARDCDGEAPRLWPRAGADDSTRSTQARRVDRAAELLGLVDGAGPSVSVVGAITHLPCGALMEARRAVSAARGLLDRAREVAAIFCDLEPRAGRALMDRLAVCGHLAGLWGAPYRWDPRHGRLVALGRAFRERRAPGTRDPP